MQLRLLATASVLLMAGCAAQTAQPPVSLAPTQAAGPPTFAPESPNSLPPGAETQAPFTPTEGNVNTTRVGPGGRAPVTSTRRPIAGTGTGTATGQPNRVPNGY